MADLPDYYTQAQISEAEAASVKGGLDANKSATPVSRDIYLATDTSKLYYCVTDGTWVDITHACLLLAGGTMTGAIAMGANKITGLANPTAAQDAATRAYVLAQKALCLLLTGGTMSGNIAMGGNKLTGLAAGVAAGESVRYEQLITPTQEFFVLPAQRFSGAVVGADGEHTGFDMDGAGDEVNFEFHIPNDFSSITEAVLVVISRATATHRVDLSSDYAASGEAYNTHSEDDLDIDTAMTDNLIYEIDVSGVLDNLAAGDYVGIKVINDAINTADFLIIGIRFKYS